MFILLCVVYVALIVLRYVVSYSIGKVPVTLTMFLHCFAEISVKM